MQQPPSHPHSRNPSRPPSRHSADHEFSRRPSPNFHEPTTDPRDTAKKHRDYNYVYYQYPSHQPEADMRYSGMTQANFREHYLNCPDCGYDHAVVHPETRLSYFADEHTTTPVHHTYKSAPQQPWGPLNDKFEAATVVKPRRSSLVTIYVREKREKKKEKPKSDRRRERKDTGTTVVDRESPYYCPHIDESYYHGYYYDGGGNYCGCSCHQTSASICYPACYYGGHQYAADTTYAQPLAEQGYRVSYSGGRRAGASAGSTKQYCYYEGGERRCHGCCYCL
ncbi:hypothetical protein QBC47DRAFT_400081 [Echria macrotheca]|uniref:Uncharacterized protein n=1 Tax=Echria macrotheca TaxID=438768 RepID=A0AAJ0BGB3_9PEZI|nr:hypothetical protein QBC47DRAFT_400081 [Echria macrotheca]